MTRPRSSGRTSLRSNNSAYADTAADRRAVREMRRRRIAGDGPRWRRAPERASECDRASCLTRVRGARPWPSRRRRALGDEIAVGDRARGGFDYANGRRPTRTNQQPSRAGRDQRRPLRRLRCRASAATSCVSSSGTAISSRSPSGSVDARARGSRSARSRSHQSEVRVGVATRIVRAVGRKGDVVRKARGVLRRPPAEPRRSHERDRMSPERTRRTFPARTEQSPVSLHVRRIIAAQPLFERLMRAVQRLVDAVVEKVLQRRVRGDVGGHQRDERDRSDREQQPSSKRHASYFSGAQASSRPDGWSG